MKQKNIYFYKKLVFINKGCIFALSITNQKTKIMTTTITKRELHLQLAEIDENSNVFTFAKNLMNALKTGIITAHEYDMFAGDLYWICLKNNYKTTNEFVSLF